MTLDQQMRSILANLELLQHGSTQNYAPTTSGGSKSYGRPPGDERPPHEHWRCRWLLAVERDEETEQREATTITTQRRDVIDKARKDLDSYRKRAEGEIVGESEEELEKRIIKEGEGEPVDRVALAMRCTPTFVRKARLKAGRSVVTGKAPKDLVIAADDGLRDRALKLKREGVSGRGIRLILGIGGSKLEQLLREAA